MANISRKNGKEHILVTGGAGYIGSHVVLALCDAGYRVTVVDNLSTGFRSAVPVKAAFVLGEVGDLDFVVKLLRDGSFDAVMHFAASLTVPESVANPLKYYSNNSCSTRALLEAMIITGVCNFVFSSTAAIYGIPEELPITEAAIPNPINPYGASKLVIEWMLRDVAAAFPFRFAALRYFNVAGADPQGRAGQRTAGATHLIKAVVEQVVGRRNVVEIFGTEFPTPDGTGVRDYIHVSDLADVHVLALKRLLAGGHCIVANCGYGRGFSVKQVIEAAERVGGTRLNVRLCPARAGDPPAVIADPSLAQSELNWRPQYDDLDTILRDALRWESRSAS
ncbi:MAG TPA: UDP-glucose 4-epimerase GalE [Sphingomicrobium sp.]|jgi:UDP-glucose 4-epimerase